MNNYAQPSQNYTTPTTEAATAEEDEAFDAENRPTRSSARR
jgi:hypothetical protein